MDLLIQELEAPEEWNLNDTVIKISDNLTIVAGSLSDENFESVIEVDFAILDNLGIDFNLLVDLDCTDLFDFNTDKCDSVLNGVNGLIGKVNSVIVINQPEFHLSISQQVIVKNILKKVSQESQIIVFTNSIPIILSSAKIVDGNAWQWVDSKEYVKASLRE